MSTIRRLRRKLQNAILLDDDRYLLFHHWKKMGKSYNWILKIRPNLLAEIRELKQQRKQARIWIHKIPGGLVDINYRADREPFQVCTVCDTKIKPWREFAYHHGKCVLEVIKNNENP